MSDDLRWEQGFKSAGMSLDAHFVMAPGLFSGGVLAPLPFLLLHMICGRFGPIP